MASELTPLIGLYKAIPGTNEPFRAADINNNWDILDTFIVNYEDRFGELEAATTDAITNFNSQSTAILEDITQVTEDSTEALEQFEIDSAEAIAALDTDAIISAITTEGFSLDINGGTA
jgi:hypothetical protein